MILSEAHVISPHDPMCRTSPKIRMLRMGAFFMALTTPPCGGPWSVRRSRFWDDQLTSKGGKSTGNDGYLR